MSPINRTIVLEFYVSPVAPYGARILHLGFPLILEPAAQYIGASEQLQGK